MQLTETLVASQYITYVHKLLGPRRMLLAFVTTASIRRLPVVNKRKKHVDSAYLYYYVSGTRSRYADKNKTVKNKSSRDVVSVGLLDYLHYLCNAQSIERAIHTCTLAQCDRTFSPINGMRNRAHSCCRRAGLCV